MKFTLITGRTVKQGSTKELGKFSKQYEEECAVCEMDPGDMEKLGVKEGDRVLVRSGEGEAVVKVKKSRSAPHPGVIFIPYGPWASMVMPADTGGTGMPPLKGVEVEVEPTDKPVKSLRELLAELKSR